MGKVLELFITQNFSRFKKKNSRWHLLIKKSNLTTINTKMVPWKLRKSKFRKPVPKSLQEKSPIPTLIFGTSVEVPVSNVLNVTFIELEKFKFCVEIAIVLLPNMKIWTGKI